MLWVGVLYALSGNLLNSVGIQLQRLTHMQNKDKVPYLKLPLWWLGLACMAAGEAGIVMAYGEAPASIVAVLGSVSVISNTLMSWLLLKEIINYVTVIGILYAVSGTALVIFDAPVSSFPNDQVYDSIVSWKGLGLLLAIVITSAYIANPFELSIAISAKYARKSVICYCLVCSLIEGVSVASSKTISIAITQAASGNPFMFTDGSVCWLTYVLIVAEIISNILQVKYLNSALIHFNASVVVPVYYILFTLVSVVIGMVLFDETTFDPLVLKVILFIAGVILACGGVFLINKQRVEPADTDTPELAHEFNTPEIRSSLVFVNAIETSHPDPLAPFEDPRLSKIDHM